MTLSTGRLGFWRFGLLFLALAALHGCGGRTTTRVEAHDASQYQAELAGKPETLKPLFLKLYAEGDRNRVLNQMQLGLAAMELGEYSYARESLDDALNRIESVFSNTENATKARSMWHEEGAKDYKGEPYERCMAYYYRGLLYMMNGDYENARASFRGGILQDSFAEEEQFRSDFRILFFLAGWTSQQIGDMSRADEFYKELEGLLPNFKRPGTDDNLLLIAETGTSPRKVADGVGHAELKFRHGRGFKEKKAKFHMGGAELPTQHISDVFLQASTRGGRAMDKILEGKLIFQRDMTKMGTTLMDVGTMGMYASAASGSDGVAAVSGAITAVGAIQTMVAMNAKPHADVRYWMSLPDNIHIATGKIDRNSELNGRVEFMNADFEQIAGLEKSVDIVRNRYGGLGWVRSRTTMPRRGKWHNIFAPSPKAL